ncbi:MAG: VWA domain-containing protein [Pseudomonadota bacterium]
MTDDLDDLKAMMTAATPKPDPAKRAADLALAQKNFETLQGSRDALRPTPVTGPKGLWTGVKEMFGAITSKGGLTATTALVACGFLLTPAGQDMWRGGLQEANTTFVGDAKVEQALAEADANFTTAEIVADREMEMVDELALIAPSAPAMMDAGPARARTATDSLAVSGGLAPVIAEEYVLLPEASTESFANADESPLKVTSEAPVSTFSIDVDTASYAVVRSSIMRGALPPADAVRVEELVNYFPYAYPAPEAGGAPFRPTVSVMDTPWNADTQLVHIAIQGELPAVEDRPPLNLVFLIDTSGSMADPTKLPLLKQSFLLMLDQLRPEDEVAIVEYAGSAGEVLAPTKAEDRTKIRAALESLGAGGSTNGQGGLEQAYAVAESMTADGEVSRVLLATDGDFNVGLSHPSALEDFIAEKRETGTFLSVLGFGRGNLQDATMQALAQNGNGTAAYIDTLSEAQKVLVDQLTGALFPIASDVKIQVEFDPQQIAEYRLIGYETRALNREDFNNDKVDAGDLGAGHTVTALYEVTPVGSPARLSDPLRYTAEGPAAEPENEIGFLKLRYKEPGAETSELLETPILRDRTAGGEAQFAAAVAGFGQILRGSDYITSWSIGDAIALAGAHRGEDTFGYRAEAIRLMQLAKTLKGE